MLRLLIVVAILGFAVVTFMPDLVDTASDTSPGSTIQRLSEGVPQFDSRLDAGASCAELISIRETFDPARPEVARMNEKLGSVGCDSADSERFR